MMADATWDFRNPASKPRVLTVLRRELDDVFTLLDDAALWHRPTACAGWDVRDMAGHLLDATSGYLEAIDLARRGVAGKTPVGVIGMAKASDKAARAFRSVEREDVLRRLRDTTARLMHEFESLSESDWSELIIPEPYLGPFPAMIIVAGLLGGAVVHGWDVREGVGLPHGLSGDAADLLVPFVFSLWRATADTSSVRSPYSIGIRTTGTNGGDTKFDIASARIAFAAAPIDNCDAVLELDPGTLVLTAYGRVNAGTVRGDPRLAANFRSLFASI
jgi:uncharacterized protein (TIGR03083 family)